jgi:hypothetical protein
MAISYNNPTSNIQEYLWAESVATPGSAVYKQHTDAIGEANLNFSGANNRDGAC